MELHELIRKIEEAGGRLDLFHQRGKDERGVGIVGSVPEELIVEARRHKHELKAYLEGRQRQMDTLQRFDDWFRGRRQHPF